MKKICISIIILISFTALSSCAKKSTDTYFIHAISFEEKHGIYTIHAISEKHPSKDEKYTVISQSGKSPNDAAKQLGNKFRDCYFATSEVYFLDDKTTPVLPIIAREISTSNTYPSKSHVIYVEGDTKELMEQIKDENTLKKVLRLCEDNKTNAIKLFSHYLSGKPSNLPCIDFDTKEGFKYMGLKKTKPTKE